MKIIKLTANNIKKLRAIEISPDGNVILAGKNGSGKSSVMDAIWLAIQGAKASKKIDKPVKNGESRASSIVEIGDNNGVELIAKRTWKGENSYIEVTDADGNSKKSPQKVLDDICGQLGFDPLEFATMDDKKRRAVVMELTGLDFAEVDNDYKMRFEVRTEIGRERDTATGALQSMDKPDPETPAETTSIADLADELIEFNEFNKRNAKVILDNAAVVRNSEDWKKNVDRVSDLIDKLKIQFEDDMQALTTEFETATMQYEKAIESRKHPYELEKWGGTEEIEVKMKTAEATNAKILAKQEYEKKSIEVHGLADSYNKCTATLDKMTAYKQRMIEGAAYPLAGLSVSDDSVLYEGKPFMDLSKGEQIKVSTAMAMALNKHLRVIMVRDGSLLDDDNMKAILDMAADQDFQVWIEMIRDDSKAAIQFSDGEIVNDQEAQS